MYVSIETDLLSDSEQDVVETPLTTNLYECSELVKRGESDLKSHTNTEKNLFRLYNRSKIVFNPLRQYSCNILLDKQNSCSDLTPFLRHGVSEIVPKDGAFNRP